MTAASREQKVEVTIETEADPERAFRVFTEDMHEWWPRSNRLGEAERTDVVIEPQVGGKWFERTADGEANDWGDVLVWDPPHRLTLSWRIGIGFVPEDNPDRASRVEVRFHEDEAAGTVVTVVHSDFERHGVNWRTMRDGVSGEGGWPTILDAYHELLRKSAERSPTEKRS